MGFQVLNKKAGYFLGGEGNVGIGEAKVLPPYLEDHPS